MPARSSEMRGESPEDFLGDLGFKSGSERPQTDFAALAEVRKQIASDLESKQGPHRRRSWLGQAWPFAIAIVLATATASALTPAPNTGMLQVLASILAAVAGLQCIAAVALATNRPALGERVGLSGILIGLAAIAVEGYLATTMPKAVFDSGLGCGLFAFGASVLPLSAAFFGLKRSGLPVRATHALALAVAALAMGGASVWVHCPAENFWHLTVGHIAIPVSCAAAVAVGVYRLFEFLSRRGARTR